MNPVIRIATWNIACGAHPRYRCQYLDEMTDLLAKSRCDIILLQEVDRYDFRSGNLDITARMASALNMDGFFAPAKEEGNTGFGNSILSRTALEKKTNLRLGPGLSETDWELENRSAAVATTVIDGKSVRLFSTHLASTGCKPSAYRFAQVNTLTDATGDSASMLGGGDFNIYATAPDMAPLAAIATDLTAGIGPTCSLAEEEALCYPIDRIYGKGFAPIGVIKMPMPRLSDHCLVICDVEADS